MPFAGFENFEACVTKMQNKGYSKESALKICGKLKAKHEGKNQETNEKDKEGCAKKKNKTKTWNDIISADLNASLYLESMAPLFHYDFNGSLQKPVILNGVLKIPVILAKEMVQMYHRDELPPALRDILADGETIVPIFKPYEELAKAAKKAKGGIPFVVPHTAGTFLEDNPNLSVEDKAYIKKFSSFIAEGEVKGIVKNIRADPVRRLIKGIAYINVGRNDPSLIENLVQRKIIDVSIGFAARFGSGGEHDGRKYLFRQKDIILGHLAGLPDEIGKCPAGLCGLNMDSAISQTTKINRLKSFMTSPYSTEESDFEEEFLPDCDCNSIPKKQIQDYISPDHIQSIEEDRGTIIVKYSKSDVVPNTKSRSPSTDILDLDAISKELEDNMPQSELEKLLQQLKDKDTTIAALEARVAQFSDSQLKTIQNENTDLKTTIDAQKAKIESQDSALAEKDKQYKALEEKYEKVSQLERHRIIDRLAIKKIPAYPREKLDKLCLRELTLIDNVFKGEEDKKIKKFGLPKPSQGQYNDAKFKDHLSELQEQADKEKQMLGENSNQDNDNTADFFNMPSTIMDYQEAKK